MENNDKFLNGIVPSILSDTDKEYLYAVGELKKVNAKFANKLSDTEKLVWINGFRHGFRFSQSITDKLNNQ